MTEPRILAQHFHENGTEKKKYVTLASAARAAAERSEENHDLHRRPIVAYECYCTWFHIGKVGKRTDPDEVKRTLLASNGWRRLENPDQERWVRAHKGNRKGKKIATPDKKTLEWAYLLCLRDLRASGDLVE